MIEAIGRTAGRLREAHRLSVRAEAAASAFRLAARLVVLLLAVMLADILMPLPGAVRGLFVLGLLGFAGYAASRSRRRLHADSVPLERAARMVEDRHPELDNALINAVQFGQRLDPNTLHPSPNTLLMQREIVRAASAAETLLVTDVIDRAAILHARNLLLAAAVLAVLSATLFPRAWRFEVPRFFLFWADYPAFTLTDFHITPQGAHVRAGGSVTITVKLGSLIPDTVSLVSQSGKQPARASALYAQDGAFTQTLENLTEDTWYYALAPTGRSQKYVIHVDQAPEVRRVSLTLHPPAYTGRGAETQKLGDEGIAGLNGTVIDVEVESNRSLDSGRLAIAPTGSPEDTVEMKPVAGKPAVAKGSFTLRRDGAFRIDLTAVDGLVKRDAARGPVRLLRDEKPIVYVTQPGSNAMITPDMAVPLKIEAEDDNAVQRVELHRIVNNMAESAEELKIAPGKRADAEAKLDFKDLGVRPGDVIQYYATAYDNTPGKPNLTDSERFWVWVVSPEDYRKALERQRGLPQMADEYRALTDSLKSLASEQRAVADALEKEAQRPTPNAQALKARQAELARTAADLAKEMNRLAGQKPQYDIERGLQKKLAELANQVKQAAGAMDKAAKSPPKEGAQEADNAARDLEKATGQSRQSIEKALSALEKAAPLFEDIARLQQLAKQQAELSMQAQELSQEARRDQFTQSRVEELAQRQEQAREEIHQLQQSMLENAAACKNIAPDAAAIGQQVAEGLEKLAVGEAMGSAASGFRKKDLLGGAAESDRARRLLESLFKQGRGAQKGAQQGLEGESQQALGMGAGNTLQQLAQGMGQGQGQGQGGSAQGENPAPSPGSRPGEGGRQGGGRSQAVALQMRQQSSGSSKERKDRKHFPGAELAGALSNQDVEKVNDQAHKPNAVTDPASGRYPAEYRRLVKEYFKAVAGGK